MNTWDDGVYDPGTYNPGGPTAGPAFGVAGMIVFATVVLIVLKKSGFRAMVAVGPRG